MPTPTTAWDETSPSGSQSISLGDNRIRELKGQVREVIAVDHEMDASGNGDDWGKHNKVSLLEQADIGSGAEGKPVLGAQTADGKAELVFTNEDDVDIQITKGTKIHAPNLGGVYPVGSLADLATIMDKIYPIGTVLTFGVSTDPATLLGIGTWTAIAGRVIVGIDAGQTEFDTLDETGGAKTHTLTTPEMPAHTHSKTLAVGGFNGGGNAQGYGPDVGNGTGPGVSDSTGGGGAHNNLQPYIVKYVWQRTA